MKISILKNGMQSIQTFIDAKRTVDLNYTTYWLASGQTVTVGPDKAYIVFKGQITYVDSVELVQRFSMKSNNLSNACFSNGLANKEDSGDETQN